ncbi:MAG: AAA family ATPase [Candidatus Aminicenantes bacterium]|nr:AAA family ATPase [Candidatus Aminicenantes bacterium]NIM78984.1 AAA family ATPase [Candidatus Aminicenantes bacterium]NIN18242.1 AAA family ATPase [Candidatus Aminicenantes bacterium]NIN42139.1 AAA family ATPase [Candidatus Aminicenantes bacterium]NIN84895.1 AAA family ATPase [Candidatus Aminicenantes bacterium]
MNDKVIKRIPYGLADYEKIVLGNYYYVDKTQYLPLIEEAGDYLFFIRPRRFGKSLFLSIMETYYDISRSDQFDLFYKGTHIHGYPTLEKNKYLILKFNFSTVDPDYKRLETSFLNNVRTVVNSFLSKYVDELDTQELEKLREDLSNMGSAADILLRVTNLCKNSNRKLYVLIDEYDNFANTVLSTSGSGDYKNLTRGEGFFRAFFNVLKGGTTGSGAPISRLFITGVSPITLDDVTSGFNIGKNISTAPGFNRMLGFTETDVKEIIDYYRKSGGIKHQENELLNIMTTWYNNYAFSKKANGTLFNPDMVFYFIDQYIQGDGMPDDLIDRNVRIDYGKLRHLIIVDRDGVVRSNGNFSKLREVIEEKEILQPGIAKGFPLDELQETNNFISLLFYFGLLTIEGVERNKLRLTVPNETVKRLFYEYIEKGYRETNVFNIDLSRYGDLMSDMAYDGKWRPLFAYICELMKESMGLRDLVTGEKSIQAFLNVYLGLSDLYLIHSEKELSKGYADLFLEPFLSVYDGIGYSYLVEIKYIKTSEYREEKVKQLKSEAEQQLRTYNRDTKMQRSIGKTALIKLVLIFSGPELKYINEVH